MRKVQRLGDIVLGLGEMSGCRHVRDRLLPWERVVVHARR